MKQVLTPMAFQQAALVDRAQMDRLATYLIHLQKWQRRINLVGPQTMLDPWKRHFLDSAQLVPLLPEGKPKVVDLGSGGGFPGMVLAMLSAADVHLIDSDSRKCVFLREVARLTDTEVTVHNSRIEALPPLKANVVTARALAPLDYLLDLAAPLLNPKSMCLFLKGRSVDSELTASKKNWKMRVRRIPSRSDSEGVILKLDQIIRRDER